ncbi:MAG: integrase arm-type DNA-binding domain-containing protein [bacterium]|nr:integrase arm-type DNA-binding domain-containing protein [bacterium]
MPKRTAAWVRSISKPGKYGDIYGLILRVQPSGSKAWIWRGTVNGRRRDLGLGRYPFVSLAEARAKAFEYRKTALEGNDPTLLRSGGIPTFATATEAVIALCAGKWKPGGKSEGQWRSSLATYVLPAIGSKRVDQVTSADVMDCLSPIWATRPETAKRVRQRIAAVMKWAIAQGYRHDNPAGDAVTAALPKQAGARKHLPALPHRDVSDAIERIRQSKAHVPLRLAAEFAIVTAVRSGEVRGAVWDEIDLNSGSWTIPGERMKAGRQHRVPLSEQAVAVLAEARNHSNGAGLVFPSKTGAEIPSWALAKLVNSLGIEGTLHGMRSSFRDWCGETGAVREVAEACLAHRIGSAAEQAYARSDLLQRRRELMNAWAQYITPTQT